MTRRTVKLDNIDPTIKAINTVIGIKLDNTNELYKLHCQGFWVTTSKANQTGEDNTILCQSTSKRDATIFNFLYENELFSNNLM